MGLLDNISGDQILGGLLSAGAAAGTKGNFLTRMAGGLQAGENFRRQRSQEELQAEYRRLMAKKMEMDMAQQQGAIEKSKKAEAEAARIDALIRGAGQVRPGMGAGLPAGTLPDDLSIPAQPALQESGKIDYRALLQQGVPLEKLKALADSGNLGRPEVARTMKGLVGGREVEQQLDKFGQPIGTGMEQFQKPIVQDFGGHVGTIDPYTQPGAQFPKTMTFGDKTAQGNLAVAQGNLALSQKRLAFDQGAAVTESGGPSQAAYAKLYGKAPPGYRWKPDGNAEAIPGGPADLKNNAGTVAKVTDAQDVLSLLDQAEPLLDKSTGSYAGAVIDEAGRAVGGATGGAKAAAQLRALEGALISKMPKMSGPQSDKDVLLYKQMAGQIGDRTIPAEQKRAAMQTIREINSRHAGVAKPAALSSEDAQAREWATKNPTDPRAKQIMQRLGGG